MSEARLSCPSCQSVSVVKNGSTRHGKQNYKCRDCGRQFVENPQWQRVSERTQDTYDLLEKLLLEKIPLAGIARVLKVSERWLQSYVNHKYENVPQQVEVEPKPKRRLTIQMDELWFLWTTKAINSGYGLPLMPRLVKLSVVISAIALVNQLRSYGNRCLASIANVRLFILTSIRLIQLSCPANVIGLSGKKRERPTILRDSTVRYVNEYQD
jgi:Transposase and inactivated derivatives